MRKIHLDQFNWLGLCAKLWHFLLTAEEWPVMAFNIVALHLICLMPWGWKNGPTWIYIIGWLYVLDFGTFGDCRMACIKQLKPWPSVESHGIPFLFF